MTGFGHSSNKYKNGVVTVEMKSVNHRFSEITFRMPKKFDPMEHQMKTIVNKYIHRGRVEVAIYVDDAGLVKRQLQIDWDLIDQYYQFIHQVNEKYGLANNVHVRDMIHHPDLIVIEEQEVEDKALETVIFQTLIEATEQLVAMRKKEGLALENEIRSHLEQVVKMIKMIRERIPTINEWNKERLEKKVKEYTDGLFDEARVLTEIAILADKADVSEEIARLESHVHQFYDTLSLPTAIGRKLDFILQEKNREANTIGAKTNDATTSSYVVELKASLEKLREQVQNIE